jgi:hypothetical protein
MTSFLEGGPREQGESTSLGQLDELDAAVVTDHAREPMVLGDPFEHLAREARRISRSIHVAACDPLEAPPHRVGDAIRLENS